jgi:hypothetical protein
MRLRCAARRCAWRCAAMYSRLSPDRLVLLALPMMPP